MDGSTTCVLTVQVEFLAHKEIVLKFSSMPLSVHDDEHTEPMFDKSLVASLVPFDLPAQKMSSPTLDEVLLADRSTWLHSMIVPTAEKAESSR